MALTISCRCGQLLAVQDHLVGKAVACPKCRAVLTVSAPAPPSPPEPPEEELAELIPVEDQEEELLELTPVEDEDDGCSYQVHGEGTGSLNLAVTGALATIRLRAGPIECLAYSPDHRTGMAASEEKLFFLDLEARQGIPMRRFHRGAVCCLTFSADGRYALSGDTVGGLLLWDVRQRKPVRRLNGHRDELTSIAFAAGGKLAASADVGGVLRLWEVATGRVYPLAQANCDEALNCVCFSPDGRLLLAISEHGKARQWDLRTGQVGVPLTKGCAGLRSAAFGTDGTCAMASSGSEFRVRRWDVRTGERQRCFANFAKRHPHVQRTLVAPGGHALVAVGFANEFAARHRDDSRTFVERQLLGPAPWFVYKTVANALESSSNQVTGQKYFLEHWDVASEIATQKVSAGPDEPLTLAASADGHRVLAGFAKGHVRLYAL